MALQTITPAVRAVWRELYRSPGRLYTRTRLSSVPKTNRDSSLNTTFCQSVTFHIYLAWHHCRRSCRCSGVKGSARKGRLDLRFASARCLEIVCGTIATPTSARIVERVTVGSTSAYRSILPSSLLVVFLVAPDPVSARGELESGISGMICALRCSLGLGGEEVWPLGGGTNGVKAHFVGRGEEFRLDCELRTL
ncbi:uncharacterized protein TNCV_497501 [Trichonephila clavipes]|nr:uncharacterized protein TNCV_497501 [Trichonephila clavipes]